MLASALISCFILQHFFRSLYLYFIYISLSLLYKYSCIFLFHSFPPFLPFPFLILFFSLSLSLSLCLARAFPLSPLFFPFPGGRCLHMVRTFIQLHVTSLFNVSNVQFLAVQYVGVC